MCNFVLFTWADLNLRVAEDRGRIVIVPSFYSGGHSFEYTKILPKNEAVCCFSLNYLRRGCKYFKFVNDHEDFLLSSFFC